MLWPPGAWALIDGTSGPAGGADGHGAAREGGPGPLLLFGANPRSLPFCRRVRTGSAIIGCRGLAATRQVPRLAAAGGGLQRGTDMPNHGAARQGLAGAIAAELRYLRDNAPWIRRREEYARLAFTELDIRRLDDRIDYLLEVLAQLCDYSGQYDAAQDFRALAARPPEPEPEPERQLRLVPGQ